MESVNGEKFDSEFRPDLTPKQMLELGVFGGLYLNPKDDKDIPKEWFKKAKLSESGKYEKDKNYFRIKASQSLQYWQNKGWIHKTDPKGWFQWYCRYYLGRRLPKEDHIQIGRWKAVSRHISQVAYNCRQGDMHCRPRQRQALLHWAYDSRKI